jgi:hypothetical protein
VHAALTQHLERHVDLLSPQGREILHGEADREPWVRRCRSVATPMSDGSRRLSRLWRGQEANECPGNVRDARLGWRFPRTRPGRRGSPRGDARGGEVVPRDWGCGVQRLRVQPPRA